MVPIFALLFLGCFILLVIGFIVIFCLNWGGNREKNKNITTICS